MAGQFYLMQVILPKEQTILQEVLYALSLFLFIYRLY